MKNLIKKIKKLQKKEKLLIQYGSVFENKASSLTEGYNRGYKLEYYAGSRIWY